MLGSLLARGWPDIAEIGFVVLTAGALPLTIVLGLRLRHLADRRLQLGAWAVWSLWALGIWLLCLPQAERTNEPTGETLVLIFLLRWGPVIAAAWLALQHWFGVRARSGMGFPVEPIGDDASSTRDV